MMHVVVYSVLSDFYRSTSGVGIIGGGDRRGMSDVALAWHPDNVSCACCALVPAPLTPKYATRPVTSTEDDNSPVVMVWDLRNAQAPEKVCSSNVASDM